MLSSAERHFLHSKLYENSNNPKQIFRICNSLLGRNKDSPLPPGFTNQELANNFNGFFITKITNIRNQPDTITANISPSTMELVRTTATLNTFWLLTSQDVSKVILSSPSKSCESDPIPTDLLKVILPVVLNLLTELFNRSLQTGTFPSNLKEALVKPLLKKTTPELIELNYQPVSNLAFIGKMLEWVVTDQFMDYICEHNLLELLKSAYRYEQSTETALLKVKTDINQAIDNQEIMCLVLLDLSVAFDTVDHTILLQRLEKEFGVTGTVLSRIKSYLTNCSQWVVIGNHNTNGARSNKISLSFWVPQGSVLSPILFTLYTCPLGHICRKLNILYHLYTDDQQIYLSFHLGPTGMQLGQQNTVGPQASCLSRIDSCISDIRKWMTLYKLKLKDDKTEFNYIKHETTNKEGYWCPGVHIGNTEVVCSWISKKSRVLHGQTIEKQPIMWTSLPLL